MTLLLLPPITPAFIWPSPHPRNPDECGGGGGGIGGGSGIAIWFPDADDESNAETEGKVEVDVLGCTVEDKELNDVVRLSAVEVAVACFT